VGPCGAGFFFFGIEERMMGGGPSIFCQNMGDIFPRPDSWSEEETLERRLNQAEPQNISCFL
jgi:hypothetical protein